MGLISLIDGRSKTIRKYKVGDAKRQKTGQNKISPGFDGKGLVIDI